MDHRDNLIDLISLLKIERIAEIGVDKGDIARRIHKIGIPIVKYYMVDSWKTYFGEGAGTLAKRTQEDWDGIYKTLKDYFVCDQRFELLRMSSEEASKKVPDDLDLVFIDADHTYEAVKKDISFWFHKVKRGGFISGDDYKITGYPGVGKAVLEVFGTVDTLSNGRIWIKQVLRK